MVCTAGSAAKMVDFRRLGHAPSIYSGITAEHMRVRTAGAVRRQPHGRTFSSAAGLAGCDSGLSDERRIEAGYGSKRNIPPCCDPQERLWTTSGPQIQRQRLYFWHQCGYPWKRTISGFVRR